MEGRIVVKSMTGYGRAKKTLSNRDITVEVRSVNNRYLDCTVKLPRAYIFAEDAIKGRVQKAISRGKVDVFVTIDSTGADEEVVVVNEGLARSYFAAFKKLYELGGDYLKKQSYVADFARIPDVLTVTKAEEDLESVGADICEVLDEAITSYNAMRATEGKKLAEDIGSGYNVIVANIVADVIIGLSGQVRPFLKEDGLFLCSGIIDDRAEEVARHLREAGWDILRTRQIEGWFSYLCQ